MLTSMMRWPACRDRKRQQIGATLVLLLLLTVAVSGCAGPLTSCLTLQRTDPCHPNCGYVELPFFGYNATCWRPWPQGWVGCPMEWQEYGPGVSEPVQLEPESPDP